MPEELESSPTTASIDTSAVDPSSKIELDKNSEDIQNNKNEVDQSNSLPDLLHRLSSKATFDHAHLVDNNNTPKQLDTNGWQENTLLNSLENIKPSDFYEAGLLQDMKDVLKLSNGDLEYIKKIAAGFSESSEAYDFVLTTGKSRAFMKAVLVAGGIHPDKIIEFDNIQNSSVYKDKEPPYNTYTQDIRLTLLRQNLAQIGVPIDGTASLCVADEIIRSGGKAIYYLNLLSQVGLEDYRFLGAIAQFSTDGVTDFMQSNRAQLGIDTSGVDLSKLKVVSESISDKLSPNELRSAFLLFGKLSMLVSTASNEAIIPEDERPVSPELLEAIKIGSSLVLEKISLLGSEKDRSST